MKKTGSEQQSAAKKTAAGFRRAELETRPPEQNQASVLADRQAELIAEKIRRQLHPEQREEPEKRPRPLPGNVRPNSAPGKKTEANKPLPAQKAEARERTPASSAKEKQQRHKHKVDLPSLWKLFRRSFHNDRFFRWTTLSAVFLLLLLLFLFLPLFRIDSLKSEYPLFFHDFEELKEKSGLREGQHFLQGYGGSVRGLLTGRYTQAEKAVLAAYPGMKELKIRLHFPGQISFEAEERIPIAYMQNGDRIVLLDSEGIACSSTDDLPRGLPVIRGLEVVSMTLGQAIISNSDSDLAQCVAVMSAIAEADFERQSENPLLPQIKEIRSSGYQRVLLKLNPNGDDRVLSVSCTSERSLKDDFIWLSKVLEANVLQDKLPGTLDIYGKQLVYRPEGGKREEGKQYIWQDEVVMVAEEQYESGEIPEELPADGAEPAEELWQEPELPAEELPSE